ncbi:hypothetical protein HUU53_01115 [Candidatus Micrarchaeota archaeon]|nr:hypothetical protein [Candidatus Micrarchaeota archaeon]
MCKRRGQVFSGDAVLSVVVFLLAVSLVSVAWNESNAKIGAFKQRSALVVDATSAADSLIRTQGVPIDWSKNDVSGIGLSDGKSINPAKFLELTLLDYDSSRELLGLGNYDYQLVFSNESTPIRSGVLFEKIAYFAGTDSSLLTDLSDSGLDWDFYDAAGEGSSHGEGQYFSGDESTVLSNLFSNINSYSTIVFEDLNASINSSLLNVFLDNGGVIVFEGGGSENAASAFFALEKINSFNAEISQKSFLVFNASVGDEVSFSGEEWAVNSTQPGFVSVISSENHSLAGFSRVRNGFVFFLSDYSMTSQGKTSKEFFNLIGKEMSFGEDVVSEKDVFLVKRPVLIGVGKNRLAVMQLLVAVR